MATRIVFLRAVNVGGGAKLPMAALREVATEVGARDARTHIASGNLVADVPGPAAAFDRALEAAIEARFGFFRESISRTPAQVAKALDAHPFEVLDPARSYITFLLGKPTTAAIRAAEEHDVREDRWRVIGREMHVRYADGAGRPQMNASAIGRALGVPGTARNLNTVRKVLELAG